MTRPPKPEIRRRIFVVGVPRSGTTLVQSLLAAHGELTSFTESHFFDRHYSRLGSAQSVLSRNPVPRVVEFLEENGEEPSEASRWFQETFQGIQASRPLLPFRTAVAARGFVRLLDELTQRRGVGGWVEKTPRHLRYLPFLERTLAPDDGLFFVHVIRDGLETVASLHEASKRWERHYGLEECVRRWNGDVAFSLGRVKSPRDVFVLYEDLTARPEATLRRLLTDLGLPWQPDLLDRYGDAAGRLVTGEEEAWKAATGRPIRASATSQRVLTAEERERVSAALRSDLYEKLRERSGGEPLSRGLAASGSLGSGPRPAVSVVVPYFNSERHLAACIESLLGQEEVEGDYEIILVDNGSTDGSASIVAGYPEVVSLKESTPGAYAARNAGIRRAQAPVIAFTDADCVVERSWLRSILAAMVDPAVRILVGHCRYPREASLPLRFLGAYENAKTDFVVHRCPPACRFAYANNMAVRAEVFERVGLFKEWKRAGDTELVHRLAREEPSWRFVYEPSVRVIHREFLRARDRARRLSLYTNTNSKIETFRELTLGQRLRVLGRLALNLPAYW